MAMGCRGKTGKEAGQEMRKTAKKNLTLALRPKSHPLKHPTLLLSQIVLWLVWTGRSVYPVTDKWLQFRNKLNVQRT